MNQIWYNKQYRYSFIEQWVAFKKNKIKQDESETKDNEQLDEIITDLAEEWLNQTLDQAEINLSRNQMDFFIFRKQCELIDGTYGADLKVNFQKMSEQNRYIATWYLLLMEKQGESITLYGDALISILEDGVLYENNKKPDELILYLGKEKNSMDQRLISFVNSLFLPFGYCLKVFWANSFGVIGEERCGGLNEILLY